MNTTWGRFSRQARNNAAPVFSNRYMKCKLHQGTCDGGVVIMTEPLTIYFFSVVQWIFSGYPGFSLRVSKINTNK